MGIARSTLNKWLHQFGFTSSDCLEVLNLAKEINRTKELSWKGCLNFATRLKRKKIKLIRVEGLIVSIAELRRKAKIGQKRLNILLSQGLNGDDIMKWAEENAFSSPKIDSFKFNNKVFKSYAEFDRYAGLAWGKTAYYKRKGFSFDDILELVRITKKLKGSGMETKTAFQRASFELTRKIQGHYIKPSTENYLKFRKLGKPPKEAATLAGVSKSNTSRLEKTLKTRGLL